MKDEQRLPADHPADPADRPADPAARFRRLPDPVDLAATIATHETDPAPDPQGGRDTERDFLLRYGVP